MGDVVLLPLQPKPLGEPLATVVVTLRADGRHTYGIISGDTMSDVDIYLTASEAMVDAAEHAVREGNERR